MNSLHFTQIRQTARVREDFGNVDELCASLKQYGLLQLISVDPETYEIVDGGRRFKALTKLFKAHTLGEIDSSDVHPELAVFLDTGELHETIHFFFKTVSSGDQLGEMELLSNIQRKAFTWKEEVFAVRKIHRLRSVETLKKGDEWTQQMTGKLLGVSRASVTLFLKVATALDNQKHPIHKASNITEALQILTKLKEDEAARLLAQKALTQPLKTTKAGVDIFDDLISEGSKGEENNIDYSEKEESEDEMPEVGSSKEESFTESRSAIDYSRVCFLGSMEEVIPKLSKVDHIITDPPYGIDMSMLEQENQGFKLSEGIKGNHDVSENVDAFGRWLEFMYEVLNDNGFCVIFCDLVHWSTLMEKAIAVGFSAQRWPLIWVKTHPCLNQAAQFNFTKATEAALVLRKGTATLIKPQAVNWLLAEVTSTKQQFQNHPFVKPSILWQWVAQAIALPGQVILDPFAGVGSCACSLFKKGYTVISIEQLPENFNQLITNLKRVVENEH